MYQLTGKSYNVPQTKVFAELMTDTRLSSFRIFSQEIASPCSGIKPGGKDSSTRMCSSYCIPIFTHCYRMKKKIGYFTIMNRTPTLSRVAYYISIVFHPGLMPTFVFWLMLYHMEPLIIVGEQTRLPLLGLIFFGTFLVPTFMLFWLWRSGTIRSMSMPSREERPVPFLITTLFYGFFTFLFLEKTYFDRLLVFVLLGITISVLLATCISYFYKISMHSMGIGGATGLIFALQLHYGQWFDLRATLLPLLVCSGLVMTARLYLMAHSPGQVWLGWLLSFGVNFSVMQFYFALVSV